MKITKGMIGVFEHDQKYHGLEIAMKNLVWLVAESLLHDIGVKHIKTTYFKKGK